LRGIITGGTTRTKDRKEERAYDKEPYKRRGLIERIFWKVKENRRLTVRYEKSNINFLGFILIAFIKIFLFNSA
jgi:transposase